MRLSSLLAVMSLAGSCVLGAVAQSTPGAPSATINLNPPINLNPKIAPSPKITFSPTVTIVMPELASCPVGFTVQRKGMPAMRSIASGDAVRRRGAGLDIHFSEYAALRIAQVKVVVHGVSTDPMLLQVADSKNDNVTETFHLQRADGDKELAGSALWTRAMGTISRVELTEITYTDGSVWRPSEESRCSVRPNGLVLVGSR